MTELEGLAIVFGGLVLQLVAWALCTAYTNCDTRNER